MTCIRYRGWGGGEICGSSAWQSSGSAELRPASPSADEQGQWTSIEKKGHERKTKEEISKQNKGERKKKKPIFSPFLLRFHHHLFFLLYFFFFFFFYGTVIVETHLAGQRGAKVSMELAAGQFEAHAAHVPAVVQ
jgi:hypothetical protein